MSRETLETNLYTDVWDDFSRRYAYMRTPVTPSVNDVKIIEEYLKKILETNSQPSVLILGATFAYRKMIAENNIPVTLVDLSRQMYDVNSKILDNELGCPERTEKLIIANWMEMDLHQEFDLIIGDFVVNNIKAELKEQFHAQIAKHMTPNGFFVTRIMNQPRNLDPVEDMFARFKDKEINRETTNELLFDALCHFGIDREKNILVNKQRWHKVVEAAEEYPFMKKLIKHCEENVPMGDKEWSILSDADQEAELRNAYKVCAIRYGKDYMYSDACPTYVLQRV